MDLRLSFRLTVLSLRKRGESLLLRGDSSALLLASTSMYLGLLNIV